jgi:hypothetical protein
MKNKRLFLLFMGLIITLIANSCKKTTQSPIQQLFTGGTWQLASVQAFNYTGNTLMSTDTLNTDTACHSTQFFTFYTNNTCTYTNFDCIQQTPPTATWSLSQNQLFLTANVVCKDTSSATGSSMPFAYAQIINLGQFSLVLLTGDIQPNYSLTKPRRVVQYGFIRQKLANGTGVATGY